ncbi:magnesium transporter [Zhenpiania hominis]
MENETVKSFDEIMQEILVMVEEKEYVKARDLLLKNNEVDIAEILEEILEELDVDAAIIMFRMLPKDVSVEVFSYLPSEDQVDIISGITEREISYIIEELDFDDKIDVLEELPANVVDKILEKTTKEERRLINTFLNYPENSAGSLMTPDYISLRDNMTVGEALAHIKKEGMDSETVYTCYVKEEGRKLEGIVSLRSLVIHDDNMKVSELMSTDYVYVNVYDDQEEVSEAFKKYGFLAIPVVDSEHRLVGIITVDDILDVIEEETTEDIERMAGVMDGSDTEYLDMGVFRHAKNRLPWLILLSVSLMITGSIIEQFEATLQQVVALTFYLPLLMGTGGNTGTQAATLIIRGLSLGDIELKDTLKVFWKEFRVSIILGIVLSAFNFAKIMLIDRESVQIAITVCASMMAVVIFAKLIGGMLPMLAKRLGIDPALMATPMISSLTDMVSSFVYLLMATAVLGISL